MCARIDQIEVGEAPRLIHPVFIKRSVVSTRPKRPFFDL
jgi:hypothetical protein